MIKMVVVAVEIIVMIAMQRRAVKGYNRNAGLTLI